MAESTEVTLLIKHFPFVFSNEDKIDFLKYFGAIEVKCVSTKAQKGNLTLAVFPTKAAADAVLKKLHQSKVLDQLLSVEYVRRNDLSRNFLYKPSRKGDETDERTAQRKLFENYIMHLNSWTNRLDPNHPPPSHLKYSYPPPSSEVLINISHALATYPKFFNQVLHLMNKMNLPCPFTDKEYSPKSRLVIDTSFKPASPCKGEDGQKLSSEGEESELETDYEDTVPKEIIPIKRRLPQLKSKIKRPKLLKPIAKIERDKKTVVKPEEIFEPAAKDYQLKKIELKLSGELLTLPEVEELPIEVETPAGGFEILEAPVKETGESTEKEKKDVLDDTRAVITSEELAANRISLRDQCILPVFKNYQEGLPSCRLYLKNLAKTVTVADLNFIYRKYFIEKEEEQGIMFDIRLMQEGRMKGQAFITLQSINQAHLALRETNGYILKDKPMVVQYARSSKPK